MTTAELRQAIPALADLVYLNCGWAGPTPEPVFRAIREVLDLEAARGPATVETVPVLATHLASARQSLADLLGTGVDSTALTGNATAGLCTVAAGLDWRRGDEVVISDQEHSSNALPWYQLQQTAGVIVREVPVREDEARMLEEYERAITARTRLIAVSHVQWSTGQIMPLQSLAGLIHDRGGWLVVDGAQSAGQIGASVEELGVDCYTVPGQKWLLGPSGTGGAYFSPALTAALAPSHVGWASAREYRGSGEYELWEGAKRYETATVSAALYAGFAKAVTLAQAVGVGCIRRRIQQLVEFLRRRLEGRAELRLLSPAEERLRSGILTVQVQNADSEEVVRGLFEEHRIVARCIPPLEAVRFSIHAYNTEEEMERAALGLAES